MTWRGFVPWIATAALLATVGYFVVIPPRASAFNCCQFPTQEQEAADGVAGSGQYATVVKFAMTLSDPQSTNFVIADRGDDRVGEYVYSAGDDVCHDEAVSLGYNPNNLPAPLTAVTTPLPSYYWVVGKDGYCTTNSSGSCEAGELNGVNTVAAYNGFGYDGVGYYVQKVDTYRSLSGMSFPCAAFVYQGMAMDCPYTANWRTYAHNDLLDEIYSARVVDCKNSVCESIDK